MTPTTTINHIILTGILLRLTGTKQLLLRLQVLPTVAALLRLVAITHRHHIPTNTIPPMHILLHRLLITIITIRAQLLRRRHRTTIITTLNILITIRELTRQLTDIMDPHHRHKQSHLPREVIRMPLTLTTLRPTIPITIPTIPISSTTVPIVLLPFQYTVGRLGKEYL